MKRTKKIKSEISQMNDENKLQLVAPCGYCCQSCPIYKYGECSNEVVIDNMRKRLESVGMSVDDEVPKICPGCRPKQGDLLGQGICATYDCCVNKKRLNFCYECEDFPCLKPAPVAELAKIRTHNFKIYNLLILKKLGLEDFVAKSRELRSQYARGKTPVPGGDVQVS